MDEAGQIRQSDRVTLAIQIEVFGSDVSGVAYCEKGRTVEVSRNGALIVVKRNLTPQEEIVIRRECTGREATAQVVGPVRQEGEGFVYGIRLLDPESDVWEIDFGPLNDSQPAVGRVLLECAKCHLREVVYLEQFEVEVFETNRYLHRPCKRCRESSIWNETAHEPTDGGAGIATAAPPTPPAAPALATTPSRFANERRHHRVHCKLQACIRYKQHYEDEILEVDDVSRGGFKFTTRKYLPPGTKLDVAIPYSPGMANIFVPGEVRHLKAIPDANLYEYGIAYLKA